MKKRFVTWKQKIFLIIAGFFIALILIETFLRIGGAVFLLRQDRFNKAGIDGKDVYRILCIGESTTALGDEFSYPAQLEKILNQKSPQRKFKVINRGIPAVKTNYFVNIIDSHLDKYQPDLVISMIGINDEYYSAELGETLPEGKIPFWESLKIRRLFQLIYLNIKYQMKSFSDKKSSKNPLNYQEAPSASDRPEKILKHLNNYLKKLDNVQQKLSQPVQTEKEMVDNLKKLKEVKTKVVGLYILSGQWHEQQEEYEKAQENFKKACITSPNDPRGYIQLGRILRLKKRYETAIKMFLTAKQMDPRLTQPDIESARTYDLMGKPEMTHRIFVRLLKRESTDQYWSYVEMGDWFSRHEYADLAEKAYRKAIKIEPRNTFIYDKLGDLYLSQNREGEAQEIFQKGQESLGRKYIQKTYDNYNKIVEKIISRGVKVICMQYPLRDIDFLRRKLPLRDYVVFVENKDNFHNALKGSRYSEYFYDFFAGDFGHCTPEGNHLIAEQLADVIQHDILNETWPVSSSSSSP